MIGNNLLTGKWLPSYDHFPSVVDIIGVDPGSHHLGLAVLTTNLNTFELLDIQVSTLPLGKMMDTKLDTLSRHKDDKYQLLYNILLNVFSRHQVYAIGIESPFVQLRRLSAVRPLILTNYYLHQAVHYYNPEIIVRNLPPLVVKSMIGAKTMKDKNAVTDALITITDINRLITPDKLNLLDEHSIDAIGVGYTLLQELKNHYR